MKIKNIFGTRFQGTIGKEITASRWKGIEYIRSYFIPTNPRTDLQVRHRLIFAEGAKTWHELVPVQQHFYDSLAEGMSGYNLFVKRWIEAHTAGQDEFELPLILEGKALEGHEEDNCWFILKKSRKALFQERLSSEDFEIAISTRDVPYDVLLRKGSQEDAVMEISDLMEVDLPLLVESEILGLKVVLDVPEEIRPPEEEPLGEA